MILSDIDIRAMCIPEEFKNRSAALSGIDKPDKPMLEPYAPPTTGNGVISFGESHAGYDLRLGDELWVFKNTYNEIVDPKKFRDKEYLKRVFDVINPSDGLGVVPKGGFIIPPHSYALGVSVEKFNMPSQIKGRCVGKSTLARCGILINTTPIENCWIGHLTIEISNITPCPVLIYSQEGIAQTEFELLTCRSERNYSQGGRKYQNQVGVTPARVLE